MKLKWSVVRPKKRLFLFGHGQSEQMANVDDKGTLFENYQRKTAQGIHRISPYTKIFKQIIKYK